MAEEKMTELMVNNIARAVLEADLVPEDLKITFNPYDEYEELDGSPSKLGSIDICLLFNFQQFAVFGYNRWDTYLGMETETETPQEIRDKIVEKLIRVIKENDLTVIEYPDPIDDEKLMQGWLKKNSKKTVDK